MKKTIVVNLLLNTVGAFLYTVAINGFLISNNLGEGGVTGSHDDFLLLAENCAERDEHRVERTAASDRLEIAE